MHARIVLATLNARYIHASLGLRYLRAHMPHHAGRALADVTRIMEFTTRRPLDEVATELLQALHDGDVQILGLGVYIWNVEASTALVQRIRQERPSVRIVLGGPEVSHEWESQPIVALADHVITGWGDVSFPRLCHALVHGPQPLMKIIPGEQPALDTLALPYAEYSDEDIAQRVLYVEASRGCPFRCSFCLSALDRTAWAFDLDRFLDALHTLYRRGARRFKFVDRTFNLKAQAGVRILQFFLDRMAEDGSEVFLHFELVPDHLPDALRGCIQRFPAGTLQFEIGIQSWSPQVQQRIDRRQDNERAQENLRWLVQHTRAHLHVDLIFGLPGENLASFAAGFDRLWALGPHEIQLGLLKRLRGTPLAQQCLRGEHPGMVFDAKAPYALQCSDDVSTHEVQTFVRLARHWDLVANSGRFVRTLPLLLQGPSAYAAFARWSAWLWQQQARTQGWTPEQLMDALSTYLVHQRALDPLVVQQALQSDYQDSGARGRATATPVRQQRHRRQGGQGGQGRFPEPMDRA